MKTIKIKRGITIPLEGPPSLQLFTCEDPSEIGVIASDYVGIKPHLMVHVGDSIHIGDSLFYDKRAPEVTFVSPASGKVKVILRGENRKLESVVIENDYKNTTRTSEDITSLNGDELKTTLAKLGLWQGLRMRPFDQIPPTNHTPTAIFINAMDTNPLGRNIKSIINWQDKRLPAALPILKKLTQGSIYIVCDFETVSLLSPLEDKQVHVVRVQGPHPAGNVGTHIHYLSPLGTDETRTVWHMSIDTLMQWGQYVLEGFSPYYKVLALGGVGVNTPCHVKVREGTPIEFILHNRLKPTKSKYRIIRGSPLWGQANSKNTGYVGPYQTQLCVLPEGKDDRQIFGWLLPYRSKWAPFFRVQLSSILPKKKYNFSTNLYGSLRAIVPFGNFEAVNALRILPLLLLRSVMVIDTKRAKDLGILELAEEDVAHFSFVDIGKNDFCGALRACLTKIEQEG